MMQRHSGFTLLEVLIAVAILAVAFTAVLSALSGNIRQVGSLQDKTAAQWVALNAIAAYQLQLVGTGRAGENQSGTANMLGNDWDWTLASSKTKNADVLQLNVTVQKQNTQQTVMTVTGFTNSTVS